MQDIVILIAGLIVGASIVLIIHHLRRREAEAIARELFTQSQTQKAQELELVISRVKDSFGALSLEALSKNTEEFLKLANETLSKQTQMGQKELEEKKKLIDQTLEAIKGDLKNVQSLVTEFEKDREKKFGELTGNLQATARQLSELQETTSKLRTALVSSKARGRWGEKMAEDVLRLAGFIEGINYLKQKALETVSTRPDFTFLLPQDLKVNMDVKFPLDNYLKYLEEDEGADREAYKNQFLQDVRARIKEVTTRDYINPEENTIDFVIVFIPNEQVYSFINECDSSILDEALKNKVILCSPITLYSILAIIRQAVDNFNLEKTAAQILSLLGAFQKQYDAFVSSLSKMGKKIEEAMREYNTLTSTRRNKLERPLRRIEDLRRLRQIPVAQVPEGELPPAESEEEIEAGSE
ncbi:MAG: DNA recombination protein RmuC [Candidatus Glassbacteria bacterium]